jgi:hypothetical protein
VFEILNNTGWDMKNFLNIIESSLNFCVYIGLLLSILIFLLFGLADISGISRIGHNYVIVGLLGLGIVASSLFGLIFLNKRKLTHQIIAGIVLIILSVVFSQYSPTRMLAIIGSGSPDQYSAFLSGATGILMLVLVVLQKATGRYI